MRRSPNRRLYCRTLLAGVTTLAIATSAMAAPVGATPKFVGDAQAGKAGLEASNLGRSAATNASSGADSLRTGGLATGKSAMGAKGERVTLITGDVVTFDPDTMSVDVAPAPRPDGRSVAFTTYEEGESFFVFPSDARDSLHRGLVDRKLFDIPLLLDNELADDESKTLPVIVQYRTGKALAERKAVAGAKRTRTLGSIDAAAAVVTKTDAADAWSDLTVDTSVEKVWLDEQLEPVLDESVPQVGAPTAWQRGLDGKGVKVAVLDTGIDATHPDLAGKVAASAVFTGDPDVTDGNGHGTHVASTIVGGMPGGKYTGVAPGASLLVGKVLKKNGSGDLSWSIAAMQWAIDNDADVISMSLGGSPTDGTDPASQAVNELSKAHGTLFVIAAGNNGRLNNGVMQVGTPGAADEALTIAAVNKQDELADFSSRGPRLANFGMKPDLAAPGVDITAARAEGTQLGPVVDERYVTISGTSMATPHVAGAAAIVLQQHPEWTGREVKAALTGSAKRVGGTAYQVGSGRLDVARVTAQQVRSSGNLDFGYLAYPQTDAASKTLTYFNDGDEPITLNLDVEDVKSHEGTAPADSLKLDRETVTVPAHGKAEVQATLDVRTGPATWYYGAVVASASSGTSTGEAAGDVSLRSAVGAYKQPRRVAVDIEVINPIGAKNIKYGGFLAQRLNDTDGINTLRLSPAVQKFQGHLETGYYSIGTDVTWEDAEGEPNSAMLTNPTVNVQEEGTKVVFDLRKAQRVKVTTPKTSVPYQLVLGYKSVTEKYKSKLEQYFDVNSDHARLWTLPVGKSTRGTFFSFLQAFQGADPLVMRMRDRNRTVLEAHYQGIGADIEMFDGRQTQSIVAAGKGLPEDFEGRDVKGKLVLLDLTDLCPDKCTMDGLDRVQNAQKAGAAGVLAYGAGRSFLDSRQSYLIWRTYPIPTVSLSATQGQALQSALAQGPLQVDIQAENDLEYVYPLTFIREDRMVDGRQSVSDRSLVRTENRIHADGPGIALLSWRPARRESVLLQSSGIILDSPGVMTSYVGPVNPDLAWITGSKMQYASTGEIGWSQGMDVIHKRPGRRTVDWGEQPLVPGLHRRDLETAAFNWQQCGTCRNGNMLNVEHYLNNNGSTGGYLAWGNNAAGKPLNTLKLFRGNSEIPVVNGFWLYFIFGYFTPYFDLPAEAGEYRMTERYETRYEAQKFAKVSEAVRTFTSQRKTDGFTERPQVGVGVHCAGWYVVLNNDDGTISPGKVDPCQPSRELYLGYDFDLDLDNTLAAGSAQEVTITGYHSDFLKAYGSGSVPSLKSAKLWVSFDDGAHWQRIELRRGETVDTMTGVVRHPSYQRTKGAVSIKAEAVDSDGNTVKQEISRAYGLRP